MIYKLYLIQNIPFKPRISILHKLNCLGIKIAIRCTGVLRQNERLSARNKIHGHSEHVRHSSESSRRQGAE